MSEARAGGEYAVVDALLSSDAKVGGEHLIVDALLSTNVKLGGIYLVVDVDNSVSIPYRRFSLFKSNNKFVILRSFE